MKKMLLLLSIMSYTLAACSQDIEAPNVPSVVINTLQSRFAGAVDIEWEKKKDHYEADFEIGGIDHDVKISSAGKIIIHKHDIPATELPANVQTLLSSRFKDRRLDDASRLEKDGQVYYQIELDKGFSETHLVFDAEGAETKLLSYWD